MEIHTGPNGGKYVITASGRKRYLPSTGPKKSPAKKSPAKKSPKKSPAKRKSSPRPVKKVPSPKVPGKIYEGKKGAFYTVTKSGNKRYLTGDAKAAYMAKRGVPHSPTREYQPGDILKISLDLRFRPTPLKDVRDKKGQNLVARTLKYVSTVRRLIEGQDISTRRMVEDLGVIEDFGQILSVEWLSDSELEVVVEVTRPISRESIIYDLEHASLEDSVYEGGGNNNGWAHEIGGYEYGLLDYRGKGIRIYS